MNQGHINSDQPKDTSTPISPGFLLQVLKRVVAKDAIVAVDVGDHTYWSFGTFITEGQRFYLCANMASMGFGLPAAISAAFNFPERQVVCLTGDGGFGMVMADFTTAVREKLPIKVIVFNDGLLKNIKKEQNRDGYPEYGVFFPNPNFATFAESAGGLGIRVEDPLKLDDALKKAFESDKPALVDVLVDPEKMRAGTKRVE